MRILDAQREHSVRELQLYLTEADALELVQALQWLLEKPEEYLHAHLAADRSRDVSLSILTDAKIHDIDRYSPAERDVILEN